MIIHPAALDIPFLWSQCHARSRIPFLSHIPLLGTPSCFLVSLFLESVASSRGCALMVEILTFIGGLLTVSAVESGRVCNGPARVIRHPMATWLAFLVGGAVIWEVVILPAFLVRGKRILEARESDEGGMVEASHPERGEGMRHLGSKADGVAIPIAVVLGFVVPSVVMLVLGNAVAVLVWLFFPVWVSLIRQGIRLVVGRVQREGWAGSLHLEASRTWTGVAYAVPVLCSVLAHAWLIWSLVGGRDDRKEMTRATTRFIEIDIGFVGLTVLYWLLVEAGWRVAVVMLVASLVLGPGAGVCLAWVYRESKVDPDRSVTVVAVGARSPDADPSEDTPLLR
jgi:hypothetical protein